jgi:aminoglycoside phosphotransferase
MDSKARDPTCQASLADRQYFNVNNITFVKRTLRRSEWITTSTGKLVVPSTTLWYRLENEAACLEYLAGTSIPVPALRGVFQDDGAVYLMTQYVDCTPMSEIDPVDKEVVIKELEQHIATLRSLRSKTPGIPGTSVICPHYRLFRGWRPLSVWTWKPKPDVEDDEDYVFCHNDLGQHNVLVDTKSLKIKAIIDWEFSGFFPRWFEAAFWKQTGSAPTIGDEDRLRAWLIDNCEEVRRDMTLNGTKRTDF